MNWIKVAFNERKKLPLLEMRLKPTKRSLRFIHLYDSMDGQLRIHKGKGGGWRKGKINMQKYLQKRCSMFKGKYLQKELDKIVEDDFGVVSQQKNI